MSFTDDRPGKADQSSSGGCQLQSLPYEKQLEFKRRTVRMAYQRYSGLESSDVPEIGETIPSPKQWGYRTKITPHFDAAPKWVRGVPSGPGSKAQAKGADGQKASGSTQALPIRANINGDERVVKSKATQEESAMKEESAMNGRASPECGRSEVLYDEMTHPSEAVTAVTPATRVDNGQITHGASREDPETGKKWSLSIGFDRKDRPGTMDIEVRGLGAHG